MTTLDQLRVKLFADGAELPVIARLAAMPLIQGFTTNPTLMRKAGVDDYVAFARAALAIVGERPISFEVFTDSYDEMFVQALEIASWGRNVFVKIPITNTVGDFSGPVVRELTDAGVRVNVTAVMTVTQVEQIADCLSPAVPSYVSIFAGRIGDTGRDPVATVSRAVELVRPLPATEVIWASPRELLNVFQADACGCHAITATADVLAKLPLVGKNLEEFSLETVRMFRDDALAAAYSIPCHAHADVA